ncbi:MAG: DUF2281 domain-containing protein [Chloroflexi bacterium]|mgnify:CR=1 FL=1|jgi:hypothetical protein|nr:DUF2281 domain-containing protein [Chloroflexota bacterium]
MKVKDQIFREMESVPEQYFPEILYFIRFFSQKAIEEKAGTAIASETSLGKDWLKPEEDEAWQDL